MSKVISIYELKQGQIGELVEESHDGTTHVLGIYAVEDDGTVRVASLQTGTTWSRHPEAIKIIGGLECRLVPRGTVYKMTVR